VIQFSWSGSRVLPCLDGSSTGQEMKEEGQYGENEQYMDQSARDMEHQESAAPRKEKQQGD